MEQSTNEYLFVYGTLLSNYGNHESNDLMKQYAKYIGKAQLLGKLYMVDYYPGVVDCDASEKCYVRGEVYQLLKPNELFDFLDKYEEYDLADPEGSEYIRKKATVRLKDSKQEVEAWVYYYNQSIEDLEWLPKGDFMNEYHK